MFCVTKPARHHGLAALIVVGMVAGGCATGKSTKSGEAKTADRIDPQKMEMTTGVSVAPAGKPEGDLRSAVTADSDKRHQWIGQKFASVIDAADKAFGEPRVEDQQEIVRAKIGIKAEFVEGEDTDWSIPSNFRIPLPALTRKANIFIDITSSSDPDDISDINADSSASLAMLKKITEDIDILFTFDIYGGWDIGPKVKFRYEHAWDPWSLFAEQQVFVRTDDGWGGRTTANFDYTLPDRASFLRFTNRADYYEELHDVNFSTALMYRRKFYYDTALSVELGVQYNSYGGDPEKKNTYTPPDTGFDDDNTYVKFRVVGKGWKDWIEWELVPGYYYKWEQDDAWRWGIDARLSVKYEAFLRSSE